MAKAVRLSVLLAVGVLVVAGPLATGAGAGFVDSSATSGLPVSTATLAPPTAVTASTRCLLLLPRAELSWTASTSAFATGYNVYRKSSSQTEYSKIGSVSGQTTTTYTDLTVVTGQTYNYVVHAVRASWSAPSSAVSVTTPGICL